MTATEIIASRSLWVVRPDEPRLPMDVARRLLWTTINRFTRGRRA